MHFQDCYVTLCHALWVSCRSAWPHHWYWLEWITITSFSKTSPNQVPSSTVCTDLDSTSSQPSQLVSGYGAHSREYKTRKSYQISFCLFWFLVITDYELEMASFLVLNLLLFYLMLKKLASHFCLQKYLFQSSSLSSIHWNPWPSPHY